MGGGRNGRRSNKLRRERIGGGRRDQDGGRAGKAIGGAALDSNNRNAGGPRRRDDNGSYHSGGGGGGGGAGGGGSGNDRATTYCAGSVRVFLCHTPGITERLIRSNERDTSPSDLPPGQWIPGGLPLARSAHHGQWNALQLVQALGSFLLGAADDGSCAARAAVQQNPQVAALYTEGAKFDLFGIEYQEGRHKLAVRGTSYTLSGKSSFSLQELIDGGVAGENAVPGLAAVDGRGRAGAGLSSGVHGVTAFIVAPHGAEPAPIVGIVGGEDAGGAEVKSEANKQEAAGEGNSRSQSPGARVGDDVDL